MQIIKEFLETFKLIPYLLSEILKVYEMLNSISKFFVWSSLILLIFGVARAIVSN